MTHTKTHFYRRVTQQAGIVLGCMALSFVLGVQTAGEVQTVGTTQAISAEQTGDLTGDGVVDLKDVRSALETAMGYAPALPAALAADPNQDGHIGVEDALSILNMIQGR